MTINLMPDSVAMWEERYTSGSTPWDTEITPPEVKAFWASGRLDPKAVAGRYALDMGCGTGTNSAYLAKLGLRVLGFDLSHTAILRGETRRAAQGTPLPASTHLIQSSVAQLPVQGMQAVYILDVGCLHSLPPGTRYGYAKEIVENLAPGGYYQLYAFDREDTPENEGEWRWLADHEAERLFAPHLEILEIRQATPAPRPCRWYLMQKPGDFGFLILDWVWHLLPDKTMTLLKKGSNSPQRRQERKEKQDFFLCVLCEISVSSAVKCFLQQSQP